MADKIPFKESFKCDNPEDAKDVQEQILDWLRTAKKIKELQDYKKEVAADIIAAGGPGTRWELNPNLTVYVGFETTYEIDQEAAAGTYGVEKKFFQLIKNNGLKPGAVRKDDMLVDCWKEKKGEVLKVNKIDPEMLAEILHARERSDIAKKIQEQEAKKAG